MCLSNRRVGAALVCLILAWTSEPRRSHAVENDPSPYLLIFAGDQKEEDQDFFAVLDVRPESSVIGKVTALEGIGTKASMPHHTEYELPERGRWIFANSHHHEETLLLDATDPLKPHIVKRLQPPAPYRFTHDYKRLPSGNILMGFLRSEGPSPRAGDATLPGGHGGIAEYTANGDFIRSSSAAAATTEPVRPYSFTPLLGMDRILTTSAAMMEESAADVVQIWRYSDFKLLHTIAVPPGRRQDGSPLVGAAFAPFAARALSDGSVLLNAYGCGIYRLTDIASDSPQIANVYTIQTAEPPTPNTYRGACAVPVIIADRFWIMPVGRESTVVTLDISDPKNLREVSRLDTPRDFHPHWLSKDPRSNRLVLGAHEGGQQGMFIVLVDPKTGKLSFDPSIGSPTGRVGYLDLTDQEWPTGKTGAAWAHAGLFLSHAK